MNIDDIVKNLPNLSQDELKKLDHNIKFYLKYSIVEGSKYESLLYDSVNSKVTELTGANIFFAVFKKSKIGYKQLGAVVSTIENFVVILSKKIKVTRLKRKQLYNLYVDVIVEYLIKYNIPVSVNSVLNCHEKFTALLDKKYPGYLENGLLYLLFSDNMSNEINALNT